MAVLSIAIIAVLIFTFDLNNTIFSSNNSNSIAYAYIFSDTENAVTKNIDGGRYQVSFLPYPTGLKANDTTTKLNFSVMQNNTDVPFLFTSLVIMDKNTG
jgi:hypothetical protein